MITAGVDLSSQDAGTATCVMEWSDRTASVRDITIGVNDRAIVALIESADKVGIDAPLGWPAAFVDAVGQHALNGSWPVEYLHSDTTAMRFRRTDMAVIRHLLNRQPLSVSTDKIALPAMRAAALLAGLPSRVALDGSGVVVEVYPAAALQRWRFPSSGYKGRNRAVERRQLVHQFLCATSSWLTIHDDQAEQCCSSDDAFDAMIAALVARASARGLVEPIPIEDRSMALREGWIALPTEESLDLLSIE
jgi:predicted nuclease with RNAse H fold